MKATVVITGVGAPGAVGTIWSLRQGETIDYSIIGVDMNADNVGKYFCDDFEQVPSADSDEFVPSLERIVDRYNVDCVLPQVTKELQKIAEASSLFEESNASVAISSPSAIRTANNKHHFLKAAEELNVPVPDYQLVSSWEELKEASELLGYPEKKIVVKPPKGHGKRGFRIISKDQVTKRDFFEEKPKSDQINLKTLHSILGETFDPLLAMEYLPGPEYSVDAIRHSDETVIVPRKRDEIRSGISFKATVVENEELIQYSQNLAEGLDLEFAFGFQFMRGVDGEYKVIECNPRIQGTMVTATFCGVNIPNIACHLALGYDNSIFPDTESKPNFDGVFHRYWGGLGLQNGNPKGNIGCLQNEI